MQKKKTGGLLDTLKTVFWAIVIALLVRTFAFEPFNIPSGSMIPTLLVVEILVWVFKTQPAIQFATDPGARFVIRT